MMIPPMRQYQLNTSLNIAAEVASTSCNSSKLFLSPRKQSNRGQLPFPSNAPRQVGRIISLLENMVLQDHIPGDPKGDSLPLFLS
jgi:hypothetical protein